jgi:hypothetical protein
MYTWMWKAVDIVTNPNGILSFCRRHGVHTIFLQLSNQVTDAQYRAFVRAATALGIRIHAMGGDEKWALVSYYPAIQTFLDRVKTYNDNALPEEQFTGIHFDIEPHTLRSSESDPADWSTQQTMIVSEWMQNVNQYTDFINQHIQVPVSVAIQMGLDNILTGDETYATVAHFMIAKHNLTAVMAYRDFAEGSDSIVYHAQAEMDYAEALKKPHSIIVGVEIGTASPEKVTFAEEGRQEMYRQLEIVDYTFSSYKAYAGVAIHSLTAWMSSLLKGETING